tara:strand:- start:34 stop:327 length:294 start_codon:yes stop_codon:yes gene_type:complete
MSLDHDAIRKAYSNVITIDDSRGAFDKDGNEITLVQSQIDAARVTLDSEWDAIKYRDQRKTEYPEIGDQLDSLYHAGSFPADMAAKIKAVKDKYPKP